MKIFFDAMLEINFLNFTILCAISTEFVKRSVDLDLCRFDMS